MTAKIWSIVHKDLVCECRARQAGPAMLVLGTIVAFLFATQMELLPNEKQKIVGALLWLATCFAGILALDQSFATEREDGCWQAMQLYPVSPTAIYLAKLIVNVIALAMLQCVLTPIFVVVSGMSLSGHLGAMVLVCLLGNVAIASVGTLLSAVSSGLRHTSGLLSLLVLPAVVPVLLAASEATRLIAENDIGLEWWRWIQFLLAFAVIFVTAGMVLIEFVTED